MNGSMPRGARGVTAPTQRVMGSPRTVIAASPISMHAVRYVDGEGLQHDGIAVVINNKCYFTPNHVEWARSLSPAPAWFQEQAQRLIGIAPEQPPEGVAETDTVDVLEPG